VNDLGGTTTAMPRYTAAAAGTKPTGRRADRYHEVINALVHTERARLALETSCSGRGELEDPARVVDQEPHAYLLGHTQLGETRQE
jgi:hypothetical protein